MDILHKSLNSFEKPDPALLEKTVAKMTAERTRTRKRLLPVAAAVAAILLISTTVLAAFGGFEMFMQRVNPPFGGVLMPVMEYVEDQGIRVTMLGARRFDRTAVVYFSIQDVTGENRVTETTNVINGVSADVIDAFLAEFPDASLGIPADKNVQIFTSGFGITWSSTRFRQLYFDAITNTHYFQAVLNTNFSFMQPKLHMTIDVIALEREYCDTYGLFVSEVSLYGNWSLSVYLEDTPDETLYLENLGFNIHGIRYTVQQIVINPIAMQMRGRIRYNPNELEVYEYLPMPDGEYWPVYARDSIMRNVYAEYRGELVRASDGSRNYAGGTSGVRSFNHTFNFPFPLDLREITAVIIDGERFERP